jgi:hypothetical protein
MRLLCGQYSYGPDAESRKGVAEHQAEDKKSYAPPASPFPGHSGAKCCRPLSPRPTFEMLALE